MLDEPDPILIGPEPIQVYWGDGERDRVPVSLCGQHFALVVCTWCPWCVRCRRPMSHDIGHWVCDLVPGEDDDDALAE